MLPGEEEYKRLCAEALRQHLSVAEHILAQSVVVHDTYAKSHYRTDEPRFQWIASSILGLAIRRFRGDVLQCQYGLPDEAEILIRSLFEARLAIRFILYPALDPKWLEKLSGTFPPIPAGRCPMAFRADLYFCVNPMKLVELNEKLAADPVFSLPENRAVVDRATARLPEIEKLIGTAWMERLRKRPRTYSGMSVADLAKYCEQTDYHGKVYGMQSGNVHAADALRHIAGGGLGAARLSIELGAGLLGQCMEDFNTAFQLKLEKGINHTHERLEKIVSPKPKSRSN